VFTGGWDGFKIFDASNLAPVPFAPLPYLGGMSTASLELAVRDVAAMLPYAYVSVTTVELDAALAVRSRTEEGRNGRPGAARGAQARGVLTEPGLFVVDVSNPADPFILSQLSASSNPLGSNVEIRDGMLVELDNAVRFYDLTDPASPRIIGTTPGLLIWTPLVRDFSMSDDFVCIPDAGVPDAGLTLVPMHCSAAVSAPFGEIPAGARIAIWPNPSSSDVTLQFRAPSEANAAIRIYDLAGRVVRTLSAPPQSDAVRRMTWDGRDHAGRAVATGAYFVRAEWERGSASSRVVRIR
jgi:hypothetical protein